MNSKYIGFIVGGVITCVVIGVFGWITVTGSSTERYMQLFLFLAPTLTSLFGLQIGVRAQQTAQETKDIVAPSNGNYKERAQKAYEAYSNAVGQKNVRGEPLPHFSELSTVVQSGWYEAARAGNGEVVK